jgi:hypothetical protein
MMANRIYTFGGICQGPTPSGLTDQDDDKEENSKLEAKEWFSDVVEYYDIVLDQWFACQKLPHADACSAIATSTNHQIIYIFIHGQGCFEYNLQR